MPLTIRFDGDTILEIDEQCTRIGLQTARGEVAATGLAPSDGIVDLTLERVAAGGPPRLDQIEAAQLQVIRERAEGAKLGYAPHELPVVPRADQGYHDETLRDGGVDKDASARPIHGPPTKDLNAGLAYDDDDTRTARVSAFASHGDVDRAIKENKPNSGKSSSGDPGGSASGTSTQDGEELPKEYGDKPPQGEEPRKMAEGSEGSGGGVKAGLSLGGSDPKKATGTTEKS